jgi:dethiobiotin synthetase
MKGFFVTGTDTGVGKTCIAAGLIHAFGRHGYRTCAMKPVASGSEWHEQGLRNADALQLMQYTTCDVAYELVNPYIFEPPIAPHIAAQEAGVTIDIQKVANIAQDISKTADVLVVEGVGGWQVPLDDKATMADMARQLGLPVILVVGMRLGCLNHALLTADSIRATGLCLAGWVANFLNVEFCRSEANLRTLQRRINAPLLGVIPYEKQVSPEEMAVRLDIGALTGEKVISL